jgi:hypothetical protein
VNALCGRTLKMAGYGQRAEMLRLRDGTGPAKCRNRTAVSFKNLTPLSHVAASPQKLRLAAADAGRSSLTHEPFREGDEGERFRLPMVRLPFVKEG